MNYDSKENCLDSEDGFQKNHDVERFIEVDTARNAFIQKKDREISLILNEGNETQAVFQKKFNQSAWSLFVKVCGSIFAISLTISAIIASIYYFRLILSGN